MKSSVKKMLSVVLSLCLLVSTVFVVPSVGASSDGYDAKSWMSELDDNTKLGTILWPGTHNSGTTYVKFNRETIKNYVENEMKEKVGATGLKLLKTFLPLVFNKCLSKIVTSIQDNIGTCQDLSIEEQLNAGVRFFDLRFRYDNGAFNVYHGRTDGMLFTANCFDSDGSRLTLAKIFQHFKDFLEAHPTETIIFFLRDESADSSTNKYNKEVEEKLLKLEKDYDINTCATERTYTNECLGRKATDVKSASGMKLEEVRRRIIDNSGNFKRITSGESTTTKMKEDVINIFKNNKKLEDGGNSGKSLIETNIGAHIYHINDSSGQCSFALQIEWGGKFIKYPKKISYDFSRMLKSPRYYALGRNWRNGKQTIKEEKSVNHIFKEEAFTNIDSNKMYGYWIMDFIDEDICKYIANINIENHGQTS